MGTRSTTTVLDEEGKPLLRIYQQYDGYIEGGVGEKLIRLLEGRRVVQGQGAGVRVQVLVQLQTHSRYSSTHRVQLT